MATKRQTRLWMPLLLALVTLILSLAACQAPGSSDSIANTGANTGAIVVSTAIGGSAAGTPTQAPFSIGAWPSNSTPNPQDTITIYIICLVQDPAAGGVAKPASGLHVRVNLRSPINHAYSGTTGVDGVARVKVKFNDRHPGSPVAVDVATTWQGVTYRGQTYFTPIPNGKSSPTPGDGDATPSPEVATPQVLQGQPTPPPPAAPTPTPRPNPTATPVPQPTDTPAPPPADPPSS